MISMWGVRSIIVLVLMTGLQSARAAEVPGPADIEGLAGEATRTYAEFMEVSAQIRLRHELLGSLDEREQARLLELSDETRKSLADIGAREDALRVKIEDYAGSDWERRYGSTGLWRRLKSEICRTKMFECEARYWSAIASDQGGREQILRGAREEVARLGREFESRDLKLLEARILLGGAEPDSAEWRRAMGILDMLCEGEKDRVYLAARLTRYLQKSQRDVLEISRIWDELHHRPQVDDELWMRAGFAGWVTGRQGWLEEVIRRWPQSRAFVGRCVLEVLERMSSDRVDWIGAYAAGLAAEAALQDLERYKAVIDAIGAVKEYRGAGVLYTMAMAAQDEEPGKAARLYMEASRKMDGEKAVRTAELAARLAYGVFGRDKGKCQEAREALRNYTDMARDDSAPDMRYCYYLVTNECGDVNEARRMLEAIAGGASGEYQERARYQLGVMKAREAVMAGRVADAARELAGVLDDKNGENAALAMEIIRAFLAREEEYENEAGYDEMMRNCLKLAKYGAEWCQGAEKYRAGVMMAEMMALRGGEVPDTAVGVIEQAGAEIGMNEEDLMRGRARVLMAKGDWQKAGEEWGRICEQKMRETKGDVRSWEWWRAKYYQLLCWSKGKDATREELMRRIEVIKSSCGPVPELWGKRLGEM